MNRIKPTGVIMTVLFSIILSLSNPTTSFPAAYKDKMTLAGLGDCIIAFKVSVIKNPQFLQLVDIIRQADCAWGNCENPLVEPDKVYPELRDDFVIACEPWGADEFKWMGIDMVSIANNHATDYGVTGLFSTIENLKRVGIGYAGAGKDLEDASKPQYIDTAGGRVAQVACAVSFPPGGDASMPHPLQKGRPGINPLHVSPVYYLTKEAFNGLLKAKTELDEILGVQAPKEPKKEIGLNGQIFIQGEQIERDGRMNEVDFKRIIDSIKIARRNARIVIVSVHAHRGKKDETEPASYAETFAHACIDAGADVYFGTGPHIPRGIEIYKNKPIFYSIGNFFFHCGSFGVYPPENYIRYNLPPDTRDTTLMDEPSLTDEFKNPFILKSVVPVITFENGRDVTGIKLYPIVLGEKEPVYQLGTSSMADEKEGKVILDEFSRLSKKYGTTINMANGTGEINIK